MTQLLVPILQKREADGTSIFDLLGDSQKRKASTPDEIVMFCVDCSSSMQRSSDFEEINIEEIDEDDPMEESSKTKDVDIETDTYFNATLDEMKGRNHNLLARAQIEFRLTFVLIEMIMKHESFEDMLAIVRNAH